jgi:hypothetical protein
LGTGVIQNVHRLEERLLSRKGGIFARAGSDIVRDTVCLDGIVEESDPRSLVNSRIRYCAVTTASTMTSGMKFRVSQSQLNIMLEANKVGNKYKTVRFKESGVSFQESARKGVNARPVRLS